ncbi:acyl-CoA dehydrogenase domain protein [Mycobacterium intracellulare 1956]|uniref:Acyl-CoA dehydrogenase domain protein n=1 Tax=Mycobacterium intracellulare 1956 TaxID=1299331 RepID=X8C9V4_MYCIT|nr:acyl-CoA dehydrogenase domain protein [Mycobacterium intracellulare 1956]
MAGWAGNPTFDLFQLPEEHTELRAAIRALAEKEIARTPPTSTRTRASRRRRWRP